MAVHAEILDTCKEIKFQKAISDPLKAGSYKDMCKQQNLQPPDWDQPSKHLKRGVHRSEKHSRYKHISQRGVKMSTKRKTETNIIRKMSMLENLIESIPSNMLISRIQN